MDAVACKLKPASTKVTNLRRKEARKKQEVVDRRKAEAMTEKRQKDKRRNSLSIEDDGYLDINMYGIDLDQEDDFNYLVKD